MKTIAFAALAVLGLALGTVNFAAPAHAANYYYGMSLVQRREEWRRQQLTPRGL